MVLLIKAATTCPSPFLVVTSGPRKHWEVCSMALLLSHKGSLQVFTLLFIDYINNFL